MQSVASSSGSTGSPAASRPAPLTASRAGGPARPLPSTAAAVVLRSRAAFAVAAAAFAAVAGGLVYRALPLLNIPGHPDGVHVWMGDFRDAVYYPVVAFLHGVNPYDPVLFSRTYPVYHAFPLYSPATLVLHLPFGLLPYVWAEIAYAVMSGVLLLVTVRVSLAWCAPAPRGAAAGAALPVWTATLAIAAAVLLSRPGYLNALLGQYTLTVALGTYVAWYTPRTRPWLAAGGLALTTIKPTYGLPLAILLLARGDAAVVVRALAIAALPTVAATAVLAADAGGLRPLLADVPLNYAVTVRGDPVANAVTGAFRVDVVAMVARWTHRELAPALEAAITVGVLASAGLALRRLARRRPPDARHVGAAIVCLAILLCTYHQNYDVPLLILPVVGLLTHGWPVARSRLGRAVLVLLLVPFANHLLSGRGLAAVADHPFWMAVMTSVNGAALLAAWAACLGLAWRPARVGRPA
jgi:hypothetical protein